MTWPSSGGSMMRVKPSMVSVTLPVGNGVLLTYKG